jgi:hypothetical protein
VEAICVDLEFVWVSGFSLAITRNTSAHTTVYQPILHANTSFLYGPHLSQVCTANQDSTTEEAQAEV